MSFSGVHAGRLAQNATIRGKSGKPPEGVSKHAEKFQKRFTTITVEKVQGRFRNLWNQEVYCSIYLKPVESHRNTKTDRLTVRKVECDHEDRNHVLALLSLFTQTHEKYIF
jgi:hypothetical protein